MLELCDVTFFFSVSKRTKHHPRIIKSVQPPGKRLICHFIYIYTILNNICTHMYV